MIKVKHDGYPITEPREFCFKCWEETNFWYVEKDVACCEECAKVYHLGQH